ncbi:MAG: pilus assembly protein PilP [Dissulfuribacterales bacterium]
MSKRIKIKRPEIAKADKVPPGQVATAEPEKISAQSQAMKKEPVSAREPDILASKQKTEGPLFDMENFLGGRKKLYNPKGRLDPFAPFVHKPEAQVAAAKEKIPRRIRLTPIEKVALSQLKLTGILRTPDKHCALVQEVSGKGYIVKQGTYIGNKGGQVKKILKDRVVVEEKYLDVYGKIAVRKSELKFRK